MINFDEVMEEIDFSEQKELNFSEISGVLGDRPGRPSGPGRPTGPGNDRRNMIAFEDQ